MELGSTEAQKPSDQELGPLRLVQGLAMVSTGLLTVPVSEDWARAELSGREMESQC